MSWDVIFKILQIVGVLGGLLATAIMGRIWLREQSHQGVSKAKDEVIALLNTELEAQRIHVERCDREVIHYREEIHTIRNGANDRVLKAAAEMETVKQIAKTVEIENAGLRAKTDLSPVLETMHGFIAEQTKINKEVLGGLENISGYFKRINGLLVPILEQKAAMT